MIRIVGVQRNESPGQEFILLQNQGSLRINLRGHIIVSDSAVADGDLGSDAHVFSDETLIPPGMYVLLTTGAGESKWAKTKEGALVYYSFMAKERPVWDRCTGPIHILSMHHTYTERREAMLLS